MKKQVKKILAMFLVVMLFLFEIGSISAGATPSSVQVDSTGYTTTTWDFSDAAQLEEDFNGPWKRNNDGKDFAVNGGYLYGATSTASDVRRVVLKKEYDVKTVSVDIVPVEGVYCGGIMLGITGEKSGGSTANPSIMVEVDDPNNTATVCTLRVRGYASNGQSIVETKIKEIDMTEGLSSGKEAQEVNLKVEISGTKLVITVTPLSGTITPYQCEVDITKDKDNNTTVFNSESLQGKVGLVARATATNLDNFSIACTDRTYDFSDAAQLTEDFNGPWKRNNDGKDFAVNGGYLYGATSTASDVRRVVLKNKYDVKTASVDVIPVDGVYCGGIMLGVKNEKSGGSTANPSIMVEVDDPNNTATVCTLRVRGYASNGQSIVETKIKEIDMTKDLSLGNEAQAVNLKVEISGTKLVITVTPLSDTSTHYQYTVDITKDKDGTEIGFNNENLQGKVGLVARVTATKLDNLYFDYDLSDTAELTIGGINNSTIIVPENRSLPTGPDVVDGKYIIDWTMTTKRGEEVVAEDVVDTYYGTSCGNLTYTYEANVVDPAMLAVRSQEGASESEGCYDVRFMATLNAFNYEDSECADYEFAGFVLSKTEKNEETMKVDAAGCLTVRTTKLYTALNADGIPKSPADLDTYKGSNNYSKYFIAHVITGIPVEPTKTIYVRAYVKIAGDDDGYVYGDIQPVEVPCTAQ